MGNSTSIEPDSVIEQISTSENEETHITAENCCMKNVKPILFRLFTSRNIFMIHCYHSNDEDLPTLKE
jgi:hypothetical protein